MIVILGALIVLASVGGGFMMAGGQVITLMHLSEFVIIGGAALGALVVMSPRKVLMDLGKQMLGALKGAPYNKQAYDELFKALYELFMMGRRSGMVALDRSAQRAVVEANPFPPIPAQFPRNQADVELTFELRR